MRESENGLMESIQAIELSNGGIKRILSGESIDVSGVKCIVFDADAVDGHLNLGNVLDTANYFTLIGGDSFAIAPTLTSIYVNQACGFVLDPDVTPQVN